MIEFLPSIAFQRVMELLCAKSIRAEGDMMHYDLVCTARKGVQFPWGIK